MTRGKQQLAEQVKWEKHWFNVKHLNDDTRKSVNFEAIQSWENHSEEVFLCKRETF